MADRIRNMNFKEFDKYYYKKLIWSLTVSRDFRNEINAYKRILDCSIKILLDHKKNSKLTEIENDGHLMVQIILLKSMSLIKLANGLKYRNELNSTTLNDIYDPFGMGNLVRSQYEAFCNFNNIYIQSINQDEIELKYYLWVLGGLNSRQRFPSKSPKAIEQKKKEAEIIEQYLDLLHKNSCYNSLTERAKSNLERHIGKREWQIKVIGDNAFKIPWHEMFSNAGVKHYDEQYNYLSSLSHPSNLSVIQFKQMFEGSKQEERSDYQSMRVMLTTSKTIMSFLLKDYITYFKLHTQFDQLPLIDQMLVNVYNRNFRGDEYVLNNTLEKLN
jgi:hypothetical protein